MNRLTTLSLLFILLFSATACMQHEIHQGNVLKDENVWLIQEGDSQFRVETLLGSPAIKDALHPNRVTYVEDHRNSDTAPDRLRRIDITYDDALRVKKIEYFGFEKK
ncbi:MAG: outer membrane protein assembly factor BamE [Mariprofundaceae bacterium]|nr:outer membrane protein assembly factor BamE [Mariprofundaceae bacterium]